MKSQIICVVFDKNIDAANQDAYNHKPVIAKINQLVDQINIICSKLKHTAQSALWLIVLPEYAISGDESQRAISPFQKNYLKMMMKELTSHYPQLTIVIDIQSYRISSSPEKFKRVSSYFDLHKRIENAEIDTSKDRESIKEERTKLEKLRWGGKVSYIRNSCLVFYSSDKVWCHDKTAPIAECDHNSHLSDTLFQPAKPKNMSPLLTLVHPFTKEQIHIGIEICHEHWHGILKRKDVFKKTNLHILLSDSIKSAQEHYCGNAVLLVDTVIKPKLVLNTTSSQHPIELYQANFYDPTGSLQGPLQPLQPFVKRLLTRTLEVLRTMDRNDVKYKFIDEFYFSLENLSKKFYYEAPKLYHAVRDLLIANAYKFGLPKFEQELLDLVAIEERNHPEFVDIHARTDTPKLAL